VSVQADPRGPAKAGHYVPSGKLNEELNGTWSRGVGIALYSHETWLSNSACRILSIGDWGCGTQAIAVTPIDATAGGQHPTVD
jgi:hypothetical protein